MGFFSDLFNKTDPSVELEALKKAQEALDDRFNKKQVSNETYRQKSMEYMKRREKLEKRLPKEY